MGIYQKNEFFHFFNICVFLTIFGKKLSWIRSVCRLLWLFSKIGFLNFLGDFDRLLFLTNFRSEVGIFLFLPVSRTWILLWPWASSSSMLHTSTLSFLLYQASLPSFLDPSLFFVNFIKFGEWSSIEIASCYNNLVRKPIELLYSLKSK